MSIIGQHINKLLCYVPFQQRIPVSTLERISGVQKESFWLLLQQGFDLLIEASETSNTFCIITFTHRVGYWCFFESEIKKIFGIFWYSS